ncbi:hypothetical protein LAT59_02145 [Candidatus Gracilibacteria bacterium]|nr:hypothetical protein [Candidatus Gracilibacteria bacterium]
MSLPPVGGIPETPEQRRAQEEADARFALLGETANFEEGAKDVANALGGIGNLPIDDGLSRAEAIRREEEGSGENPDLILSQLDGSGEHESGIENISEEVQELVDTPFIERLINDKVINRETGDVIQKELLNGGYFLDIINNINSDKLSSANKQAIIDRWGMMNSEHGAEELSQDFERDYGNSLTDRSDGVFNSGLKQDAYNLVASKYMIGESDNDIDREKAVNMAFGTAVNGEIQGKHFPRTEYFYKRLSEVKNPDLNINDRLQAFTELLAVINTDQGGKGSTVRKANERTRMQNTIAQVNRSREFQDAQQALITAQQANEQAQIDAAESQIAEIAANAGVEVGDLRALGGGEVDIGSDTNEDTHIT